MRKIQQFLSDLPTIESKYTINPSPRYKEGFKRRKKESRFTNYSGSLGIVLYISIVITIISLNFLKTYQYSIRINIFAISLFFISFGIFLIVISALTNRIQKSTLLFSIVGIILSFYTYYIATILPRLTKKIPIDFNILTLFTDLDTFLKLMIMFGGILILFLEIGIVLALFIRMFIIKIDSCISNRMTKYIIVKTSIFDNIRLMIFILTLFTLVSYGLTSEEIIDWMVKISSSS